MKTETRSFWQGFVIAALLFGGAGLLFANALMRYGFATAYMGAHSYQANILAAMEAGDDEKAALRLKLFTWSMTQNARHGRCMSEHDWVLWFSNAGENCRHIMDEEMPADWEPYGMDKARERYPSSSE